MSFITSTIVILWLRTPKGDVLIVENVGQLRKSAIENERTVEIRGENETRG
jgi:hypothetical protein